MDDLFKALKELALSVKRIVEERVSKGEIKPDEEVYFRWKVNKFQYTDKGIVQLSADREHFTKTSWLRSTLKLIDLIKKSEEFNSVLKQLTTIFNKKNELPQYLEYFVGKLINGLLSNTKFEEKNIDDLIKIFLKDLREEPVKYGAEVELEGVILRPEKIEPSYGITLRRTKVEDIEKEYPVSTHFTLLYAPSAILNIELLGRGVNEVQKRIEQSIAILRLFKVGSVIWKRYRTYSDSITDTMARFTISSGRHIAILEKYLITEEDVPRLKRFWQTISGIMPLSFYEHGITRIDYLTVAYYRYNDSLFQNGTLERRIANAVMGLEALFLKSGEVQELVYRLSFRISKLLSLLGYDPYEVREKIRDAYKIRNLFAHGGHLSCKERRKIESKYKNVTSFLRSLLEYLRISILVMMLSKKEKDELIDLIDDSFLDKNREELLKNVIRGVEDILR